VSKEKAGLANRPVDQAAGEGRAHKLSPTGKPGRTTRNSLSSTTTPERVLVHISQLIPTHGTEADDDTFDLLPDEMYGVRDEKQATRQEESTSHSVTGCTNICEFKVKGSEADKCKLLTWLEKFKDIFSTSLRGKSASVIPMKIHVEYDLYKADRRSRELRRRPQTAA